MNKSGKSVKYKKQKLSSEVMAEVLRSDDSEDELVEFINSSFPKNGPAVANNNKRRSRTTVKAKEDESMQEIDLNGGITQSSSAGANLYDLSSSGESIILGERPRSARSRLCIAFGLFVSFYALVCFVYCFCCAILILRFVHFDNMNNVCHYALCESRCKLGSYGG